MCSIGMKWLKTKERREWEECVEPQGWDKDREEESVDGIAHCDFAKRKEAERCSTCVCELLIAVGRNIMLEWDVHSCLCLPGVWAWVQPVPESDSVCVCVFEIVKQEVLLCSSIKRGDESQRQRAKNVQCRWSKSRKLCRNHENEWTCTHCLCLSVSTLFSGSVSKLESVFDLQTMHKWCHVNLSVSKANQCVFIIFMKHPFQLMYLILERFKVLV